MLAKQESFTKSVPFLICSNLADTTKLTKNLISFRIATALLCINETGLKRTPIHKELEQLQGNHRIAKKRNYGQITFSIHL